MWRKQATTIDILLYTDYIFYSCFSFLPDCERLPVTGGTLYDNLKRRQKKGSRRIVREGRARRKTVSCVACGRNMADIGRRQQPTTATLASSTVHSELQWRSEEEEDDSEEHTEDSASSSSDEREPLHIESAAQQQQQQCYLANHSESQPFSSNHIGVTPNHPGNPSSVSLSRPQFLPPLQLFCL